jgi:alpha-1,6-mannosyltransferase
MKIVHISNMYGPRSGGIRTTMHALASAYSAAGHEVTLIVPGRTRAVEDLGFATRLRLPSHRLPLTDGYRLITDVAGVRRELDVLAPDRLEISDRTTLPSLGAWARRRGVSSVLFAHERLDLVTARLLPGGRALTPTIDRLTARQASYVDTVVATTAFAASEFARVGARNLARVPLGVDLSAFHPAHRDSNYREHLLEGADVLLVHVGRLSPEKRPERSVAALAAMLDLGINARLVVAGSGPCAQKVAKAAAGLPVSFLGFVHHRPDLAALLACADVTLMPGPVETFGLAALESLACGTPVVASRSSALAEVVADAGICADDNPVAFARAAAQLSSEGDLGRLRARGRAEHFSWQATVEALLALHPVPA